MLLRKADHQVDIVENGELAVEAVCDGDYDVILMDVQMPILDGVQATRLLRALPPPGAGRVARFSPNSVARPNRARFSVGYGLRTPVGPCRPQENVHNRLRLCGGVRIYLLRVARYQDPGADFHRRRTVPDPDHDNVRPRSGTDCGKLFAGLRYSGTSLGYQLASIIAGGPSPFIATALYASFQSSLPIALYIVGCAVIGIVSTALLTDYTNKDISEEYDKTQAPAQATAD